MLLPHNETLFDSTATSSGNSRSSPVVTSYAKEAIFFLNVTAIDGTLNITIRVYNELTEKWHLLATFDEKNCICTDEGYVGYGLGEKIACDYVVSPGGSVTFSLTVNLKDHI